MSPSILDTNVLLRFLLGDESAQYIQAELWFKDAEQGRRTIVVPVLVIAETAFVLESFYKQTRQYIADTLEIFIGQRWLKIDDRDVMIRLWLHYRAGLHFVDSYVRAWADIHSAEILSFDKKLLRKK